jgi:hypothetical protein
MSRRTRSRSEREWVRAQLEVNQELFESSAANLKALWGQGEPVKFTTKVSFEVTRDCLEAATRTQDALAKLVAEQTSDLTEAIGKFTERLAAKAFAAPESMSARRKGFARRLIPPVPPRAIGDGARHLQVAHRRGVGGVNDLVGKRARRRRAGPRWRPSPSPPAPQSRGTSRYRQCCRAARR